MYILRETLYTMKLVDSFDCFHEGFHGGNFVITYLKAKYRSFMEIWKLCVPVYDSYRNFFVLSYGRILKTSNINIAF